MGARRGPSLMGPASRSRSRRAPRKGKPSSTTARIVKVRVGVLVGGRRMMMAPPLRSALQTATVRWPRRIGLRIRPSDGKYFGRCSCPRFLKIGLQIAWLMIQRFFTSVNLQGRRCFMLLNFLSGFHPRSMVSR